MITSLAGFYIVKSVKDGIIAKMTKIYDRNIEFDQDFFKNETIRGIEHTVIKGELTYIPDSCDHCNGENKDYMIVKNGNQIMHKH